MNNILLFLAVKLEINTLASKRIYFPIRTAG
nr:MAG TPA: hypothetical protein [Caudoviricetes sp.]